MDNPFKKRATEFVSDANTLLPLVSPTPIEEFFKNEKSELLEKLTIVVGTPGCGKTTIARVIEFESLAALVRDPLEINKELSDVLGQLNILKDVTPTLLAYRLPMTTNFRSIWDLPYSEQLRATLLRAFVQSKAVLGWFRQLESVEEININDIDIILREDSESASTVMGAHSPKEFREYAREIELAIFRVITSLVAPSEQDLAKNFLNTKYDVFEEIESFRIKNWIVGSEAPFAILKPMAIVDDAHELHPAQFTQLRDWLKRRNIRIGRWVMCRPDVVSPEDYRDAMAKDVVDENEQRFGTSVGRDYFLKLMQLNSRDSRKFKSIARDISSRYISGIPEFTRRSIKHLHAMLDHSMVHLPKSQLEQLEAIINKTAKDARFSPSLVNSLQSRIPASTPRDEALAALKILLHREKNRTPQLALLELDTHQDDPVTEDRTVRSSLIDGARIQLMHDFNRPYYYSMDKLAEASNSNIEQFIRLSGVLVDELLAKTIRGKKPELSAKSQHEALVGQAHRIMKEWDFPYHSLVRDLIHFIAVRCKDKTLAPNAPLDDGANAIGIPQEEMDKVLSRSERLTRVLHFAFAYKALVFVPQYKCKGKIWCLLELGAVPCIAYGLTLRRGGFIEDTLSGLQSQIGE